MADTKNQEEIIKNNDTADQTDPQIDNNETNTASNGEENEHLNTNEEASDAPEEKTDAEKLTEAEAQIDSLKDQLLRQMAEFDNYRKRTIKEKSELILNGGQKVLESLLPVLDDLERAQTNMDKSDDVATLKEGVDKTEAVKLIASVLEPLVGKIPGLLHLEIRQAFNGMDYALYSEFESREALENYAVHPLHQEAKTHFFHLLDSRVAADYEV